jgi:glycosyltransferase involved in cell wall biosynthesis
LPDNLFLLKRIVFTVTNDLSYDQRMQRICMSLANAGYNILLVGRKMKDSVALKQEIFKQKRLHCFFNKSFLFYAEYNMRLFFFLLFEKMDAICAIDLDTILPCYFVSFMRRKKRVYDAHELFTEMKEVITRPSLKKAWIGIEKFAVPKFKNGYAVSYSIAEEFKKRYGIEYAVIRSLPYKKTVSQTSEQTEKILLYQGAVNEARGLENLITAMKNIHAVLLIYGDGNILNAIKSLIKSNSLEKKVLLKGKALPEELDLITPNAYIGINLVEPQGLNQLYSLANKFFDYIQAIIPQLTMNFPEYKKVNDEYEVAVLINKVTVNEIASALNLLLNDGVLYERLKKNCEAAKDVFTWQKEEKQLLKFYKNLFDS